MKEQTAIVETNDESKSKTRKRKRKKDDLGLIKKRLYSIPEAAVYLGRTAWAVREMLWAGKLPYVKDGKRILIDIRDMREWINNSKTRFTY